MFLSSAPRADARLDAARLTGGRLSSTGSFQHPNRQHHRLNPFELQASLNRVRRLVVQQAVIPLLFAEDQASHEEDRARELFCELAADFFDAAYRFRSNQDRKSTRLNSSHIPL